MSSTPVLPQLARIQPQSWTNADAAATPKTIFTAGVGMGSKVTAVNAASSDTSARVFLLQLVRSATTYNLGALSVPITAGTDGATPTANLLSLIPGLPVDNDGQPYLFLQAGDILQATNVTQVTAAKEVDITVLGADF